MIPEFLKEFKMKYFYTILTFLIVIFILIFLFLPREDVYEIPINNGTYSYIENPSAIQEPVWMLTDNALAFPFDGTVVIKKDKQYYILNIVNGKKNEINYSVVIYTEENGLYQKKSVSGILDINIRDLEKISTLRIDRDFEIEFISKNVIFLNDEYNYSFIPGFADIEIQQLKDITDWKK